MSAIRVIVVFLFAVGVAVSLYGVGLFEYSLDSIVVTPIGLGAMVLSLFIVPFVDLGKRWFIAMIGVFLVVLFVAYSTFARFFGF